VAALRAAAAIRRAAVPAAQARGWRRGLNVASVRHQWSMVALVSDCGCLWSVDGTYGDAPDSLRDELSFARAEALS
jgi:hypothetical protein